MSCYDRLCDLPLVVEATGRERRERDTSSGFVRATTTFVLEGAGAVGRGEDVTYDTDDHDALDGVAFDDLLGEWTLDGFSRHLDARDLFPAKPPGREDFRHYRRWAFESAALDLALRQAGTSLSAALDREPSPVNFVASTRLDGGDPARLRDLLAANSDLSFKLDPTPEWTAETFAALRETGAVRILDLKGHYEGTTVDQAPDPALYERVFGVPGAVVEDPAITDETREIVEANAARVSWDAPITGVESCEALPFEPSWLNVKPSRFGSVRSLLETIEWADARDVSLYGGGQFELGVGRAHVQLLASLCYPTGPNDVAPPVYNDPGVPEDPPTSPLAAPANSTGLSWE